jgi:hypothetical protein
MKTTPDPMLYLPFPVQRRRKQASLSIPGKGCNPALPIHGQSNVAAVADDMDEEGVRYFRLDRRHAEKIIGSPYGPAVQTLRTSDFTH